MLRVAVLLATVAFAACALGQAESPSPLRALLQLPAESTGAPTGESQALLDKALRQAAEGRLAEASRELNAALRLDTRNASLHFFNALIYHLQARQGESDKISTAIEGYQQAIRFDPNHWVAHEFLGIALMEQRQYARAQAAFAEVLLARPDDADALARAMGASYMAGDAAMACALADRLSAQPAGTSRATSRSASRAMVVVYGACGAFDKARARLQAYAAQGAAESDQARLKRRLGDWKQFHDSAGLAAQEAQPRMQQTQYSSVPGNIVVSPGISQGYVSPLSGAYPSTAMSPYGAATQVPGSAPSSGDSRMVLVDVVMVRTEDSISTSKGINLLNALTLQFGSSSTPAFGRVTSASNGGPGTTVLTRAITIPALTYSLNIANANSELNEVLARPTLAALEGMRSEFFSGTMLNAAVVSSSSAFGSGAVSIEKRYGVRLTVLPQILKDGMVKLTIDASRTFLKPPSNDIGFTYKLEISEITANANVVMRMGDTLILGGLSEKESTNSRDGVPGLQETPGLQYLFSRQAKTDFQKSVLILITPRPASYAWLTDESRAAYARNPDDPFTPSLDVLRARHGDWFKPYPNIASVFHHLNGADLYREFRTGDVMLDHWERMDSTRERLKQALEFLHY